MTSSDQRPIYNELEPVYTALAIASIKARDDPEWGYVRERLDLFTSIIEDFVEKTRKLGWTVIEKRVLDKLSIFGKTSERWELMNLVLRLEEQLDKIVKTTSIAYSYVLRARLAAFTATFLLSIIMVWRSASLLAMLLSILALSMSISALLLVGSKYSSYPAVFMIVLFIFNILFNKYTISIYSLVILSILLLSITIMLPNILKRTFNIEGFQL